MPEAHAGPQESVSIQINWVWMQSKESTRTFWMVQIVGAGPRARLQMPTSPASDANARQHFSRPTRSVIFPSITPQHAPAQSPCHPIAPPRRSQRRAHPHCCSTIDSAAKVSPSTTRLHCRKRCNGLPHAQRNQSRTSPSSLRNRRYVGMPQMPSKTRICRHTGNHTSTSTRYRRLFAITIHCCNAFVYRGISTGAVAREST